MWSISKLAVELWHIRGMYSRLKNTNSNKSNRSIASTHNLLAFSSNIYIPFHFHHIKAASSKASLAFEALQAEIYLCFSLTGILTQWGKIAVNVNSPSVFDLGLGRRKVSLLFILFGVVILQIKWVVSWLSVISKYKFSLKHTLF